MDCRGGKFFSLKMCERKRPSYCFGNSLIRDLSLEVNWHSLILYFIMHLDITTYIFFLAALSSYLKTCTGSHGLKGEGKI